MTINSIGPSFKGYIKVNEQEEYNHSGEICKYNHQRIFNTNSIAIEKSTCESQYKYSTTNTYILFQNKKYPCNVDFETLKKAILKADKNPYKVIDVENFKPDVDYKI